MKTTLVLLVLAMMTACGAAMNNDRETVVDGGEYDDLMARTHGGHIVVKLSENSAAACGQTWRVPHLDFRYGRTVYNREAACRQAAGCDQPHKAEGGPYYYPPSFNDSSWDEQSYCQICECW